jgi:flagella basal body P-ring formation protein FlgA
MNGTSNIQHSTFNIEPDGFRMRFPSAFDVRRSMFGVLHLLLFACLGEGFAAFLFAGEPPVFPANAAATVAAAPAPPAIPAPPRLRSLAGDDLLALLTAALQEEYVRDRGELELRLPHPWTPRNVPDELITVKILEMPSAGVTPSFIVRFELRTEGESLGTWQIAVQARVWREIWVARTPLKRGDLTADADIERQRRDVLALREAVADFAPGDTTLMLAEPLQAGSPLLARSIKARPVILRGQTAVALVQDGALSVTIKVEALEDGAPGQIIRARNSQSRRDLRGKVLNEQTILVSL